MTAIEVRAATLDDTAAISNIFRSHIGVWQRVNANGQVEDVAHEQLTIYERWLHGGPWMSIETGAIHLSHLLMGAGIPLVAWRDGHLFGYAEAYNGIEPAPYGNHLHLAYLSVLAGEGDIQVADALISHLLDTAQPLKCERLTASQVGNDPDADALYRRHGMLPIAHLRRMSLPAKSGQGFYKTAEHLNANAAQIANWYMPVGRLGSARQQWETLWPRTFNAVQEIATRRTHRLHLSAAGQEAFLCCQQGLYIPRNADVYLWSPKPLTSQLLTAIRDWAHREGYRTLIMAVPDETASVLGTEAEPDGYTQSVYAVDV